MRPGRRRQSDRSGSKLRWWKALRESLSEAQNHRCAYCGVRFGAAFRHWKAELTICTIDHFTPIAEGGRDEWENLVAACKRCNEKRKAQPALAFFESEGWWTAKDRRLGLDFLRRAIRKAKPKPE